MNSTIIASSDPSQQPHAVQFKGLAECYKLPYGKLGCICMILNFYGLIVNTLCRRSPWTPWHHLGYDSKALHNFSLSVGLGSLGYTLYATGNIFLRCNLHDKLVVELTAIKVAISLATQGHSFTMTYLYRPSQKPATVREDEEASLTLQQRVSDDDDTADPSESHTSSRGVIQKFDEHFGHEWNDIPALTLVYPERSGAETPPQDAAVLNHISWPPSSASTTNFNFRVRFAGNSSQQNFLDKTKNGLASVANRSKRWIRWLCRKAKHYLTVAIDWFVEPGEPISWDQVSHLYPLMWLLLIIVLHIAYGLVGGMVYNGDLNKFTDAEMTPSVKAEMRVDTSSTTLYWFLPFFAVFGAICGWGTWDSGNSWKESCLVGVCGTVFVSTLFGILQALDVEFAFGVLVKNELGLPMGGGVASPVALLYSFVVL